MGGGSRGRETLLELRKRLQELEGKEDTSAYEKKLKKKLLIELESCKENEQVGRFWKEERVSLTR